MKNVKFSGIVLIFLLLISLPGYNQTTDWLWAKHTNGSGSETGIGVEVDRQNNAYFIGTFTNSITFGTKTLISNGQSDVYLVKYDGNGNVLWAVSGGSTGNDYVKDVAIDRDGNPYIIGSYSNIAQFGGKTIPFNGISDIYIAKYTTNGDLVWLKSFGSANYEEGIAISIDSLNKMVIGGSFISSINIDGNIIKSNSNCSFFIARFDTSGSFEWVFHPSKGLFHNISAIETDQSGEIFVCGQFIDTISFDSISLVSQGQTDAILLKICASGKLHWARSGQGLKQGYHNGMCINEYGDIIITGTFNGSINFGGKTLTSTSTDYVDIFLVKYDTDGNVYWATKAGGNNYDQGKDVCVDRLNNIYVTGFFNLTASFGSFNVTAKGSNDIFVAKFNSGGSVEWVKGIGNNDYDIGYGITIGTNNKIFVTGVFEGTCTFGNITLTSNSFTPDAFLGVIGVPAPPSIIIISHPVGDNVCYGDYVEFQVSAIGKNIKYQWKRDNHIIPGADSSVYEINNATFHNAGTYTCELSDSAYSVITNNAILTVDSFPVIITHPLSVTRKKGEAVSFEVIALMGKENYQWFKNDVPIQNATMLSYSIASVKFSDSGYYKCAVYNDCGDTVSKSAKLTVTTVNEIEDINSEIELNIFPNPATECLYINLNKDIKNGKVQIINSQGAVLTETAFIYSDLIKIDVSNLNKGFYFIKVFNGKIIRQEKLVIR